MITNLSATLKCDNAACGKELTVHFDPSTGVPAAAQESASFHARVLGKKILDALMGSDWQVGTFPNVGKMFCSADCKTIVEGNNA